VAKRQRTTSKVRAAARRNIRKAQVTRIRRKEPRSLGRRVRQKNRGSRA
jgi:hypothetical protein